jgi:hypothetical protein
VFDAEAGPCVKCGTPWTPPVAKAEAYPGLYSDRYADTNVVPVEPVPIELPRRHRSMTTYMIWSGVVLTAAAFVAAIVFMMAMGGGDGGPKFTGRIVGGVKPAQSATATLPPTIELTLAQLNEPNFSARVSIQGHIQLTTAVAAKAQTIVVSYTGIVSGGNQWGTLKVGNTTVEVIYVNGQAYSRTPPTGKWGVAPAMQAYRIICPPFGLKSVNALSMVAPESKNGQDVNHLRAAVGWWSPDFSRLSLYDLSGLRMPPDQNVLDLWVTPDGTPVAATYSGKNLAGDTALLDIEMSYTFTQVGEPVEIKAPGPGWTSSPAPTPSPSPTP